MDKDKGIFHNSQEVEKMQVMDNKILLRILLTTNGWYAFLYGYKDQDNNTQTNIKQKYSDTSILRGKPGKGKTTRLFVCLIIGFDCFLYGLFEYGWYAFLYGFDCFIYGYKDQDKYFAHEPSNYSDSIGPKQCPT